MLEIGDRFVTPFLQSVERNGQDPRKGNQKAMEWMAKGEQKAVQNRLRTIGQVLGTSGLAEL